MKNKRAQILLAVLTGGALLLSCMPRYPEPMPPGPNPLPPYSQPK